ncbi:hypothetical protein GYMLUDRAFT_42765 [Collybiopsis luxurians FD-317 M1]|uniref:Unplaced genomic scaffold GYMLUscaffold_22, whole genome shotgun sequence n=1 Tax=Collybiopsis luxurians FD-317 M1 TaxID=944289 RepID=A0A0D0CRB5_9AGAR|nr:hypothetical protein GYMLUDRAFT_42765 [Collybiopsis luxurians FD-317 M1]
MNPNYKPANKYVRPSASVPTRTQSLTQHPTSSTEVKEVVLNGVAFKSSGRSLVRKDLPTSLSNNSAISNPSSAPAPTPTPYLRKSGHLIASNRVYKPKSSRGRRGGLSNRNMTLTNGRRPYQPRRGVTKRMKYSDKQCPRFSTTGSCSRGLTCMYQHDPSKIAICWNFLQDNCSKDADTCNLSHDPTPERTPLCLHFLNKGRCTRPNCLFPHVNVGARRDICRDFAVLGYCEKGLDCDKQHVRECPDFAEKGTCSVKGCKLPHVIRANRNRKPVSPGNVSGTSSSTPSAADPEDESRMQRFTADDAQLGDEYISLTFNESESEDESDEEDEGEEEEEGINEDGDDPNEVDDELPVVG